MLVVSIYLLDSTGQNFPKFRFQDTAYDQRPRRVLEGRRKSLSRLSPNLKDGGVNLSRSSTIILTHSHTSKGILLNVGGQTGKDCLFIWADGVKVADRRDRTRNFSLRKRCTNHCTTGPHTSTIKRPHSLFSVKISPQDWQKIER